ncbi:invasion associated locus B family protein [Hoeflea marina]|uniref:invasion associated locus B family protein n=1 Tax=Hoeflea marina TaxID=274592 RepID=UPI001304E0EA|nr:invasion associated locus B family protein [Hoeflea marina]
MTPITLTTVSAFMLLAAATQPSVAQTDAASATPPQPSWTTQCASANRRQPLACAMEQRVVLKETGQQLAKLTIKTGPDAAEKPTLLLQLPLGISLRKGVSFAVDDGAALSLDIQTCEASGCYVGDVISDELLAAMRKGSQITIGLENLQQKEVKFAFSLSGFSASLDSIR